MTRSNTWLNNDGLKVPFGASDGIQKEAGAIHTKGSNKELRVNLDISNLPRLGDSLEGDNLQIPAGASILSAVFVGSALFSGAATIGTQKKTSPTDNTGVVSSAAGLIASGTYAADTVYGGDADNTGAGDEVGTTVADDLYVYVAGTLTTGAGELVVTYRI